MKIRISVEKREHPDTGDDVFVAWNPDGILIGETFAYKMSVLEEVCLPELKDISIKIYEDREEELPDELKNFEGFILEGIK